MPSRGKLPPQILLVPSHLGIGNLRNLFRRARSPVQLFQPLEQLTAAGLASRTVFTIWTVDSHAGQQETDSTSHAHKPPAVRSARLAGTDTRSLSANARTRATWGYKLATLCPLADRHGDPALAPHLGHGTDVKSGFIREPHAETRGEGKPSLGPLDYLPSEGSKRR